ncbi:uncharacterized protein BCR38DRAFT_420346 [Pseudomassariella vexata]|uniref:Uncharacterized protein n=1 Tax=Pseudomassariella vexata TaxID=1141098 RepID=A0A1Y2EE94_9PEZI|nr:uncharacterized protein BCR38DRAFT_420346 [Pseudomassariella vexata]ORY69892.1 hypothetical protein BCR38DRAFT_420346 [Pseudomassariella vexata]
MACHGCRAMPSKDIAVMAAVYSSDQGLAKINIVGHPVDTYPNILEEGIYIFYGDRALQVAATPCDRKTCLRYSRYSVCSCQSNYFHSEQFHQSKIRGDSFIQGREQVEPCRDCLFDWLNLHDIARAAKNLYLQLLHAPRTLSWTTQPGELEMLYEGEIQGISDDHFSGAVEFPPHFIEWMQIAWFEFLNQGCRRSSKGPSTTSSSSGTYLTSSAPSEFSAKPPGSLSQKSAGKDDNIHSRLTSNGGYPDSPAHIHTFNDDSNASWDDCGIPIRDQAPEPDDFDFFNDIIKEEFPAVWDKVESNTDIDRRKWPTSTVPFDRCVFPSFWPDQLCSRKRSIFTSANQDVEGFGSLLGTIERVHQLIEVHCREAETTAQSWSIQDESRSSQGCQLHHNRQT